MHVMSLVPQELGHASHGPRAWSKAQRDRRVALDLEGLACSEKDWLSGLGQVRGLRRCLQPRASERRKQRPSNPAGHRTGNPPDSLTGLRSPAGWWPCPRGEICMAPLRKDGRPITRILRCNKVSFPEVWPTRSLTFPPSDLLSLEKCLWIRV